ncbi:MAG: polysaccharide pyruvyl transferase family protein, partial [Pseudomonadota bacterium]
LPAVTEFNPEAPGQWAPVMRQCAGRLAATIDRPAMTPQLLPPRREGRTAPTRQNLTSTVALLNDTTNWYHFGCTGTSLAIHHQLRARGHSVASVPLSSIDRVTLLPDSLEAFDDDRFFQRFADAHPDMLAALDCAETVYVNGEGTLHRLNPQPLALLYLMRMASTRLGKPVRVINHSCYPEGHADAAPGIATRVYRHVYHDLDDIAVREPTSATVLRGMGLNVRDSFDCLPLYIDEQLERRPADEAPYVVIAGGVAWSEAVLPALVALIHRIRHLGYAARVVCGANAFPAVDESAFVNALWSACAEPLDLVLATSESDWLNQIANASLVVSARFHHSIAAAFLGTPFLVSQSNTPKIGGLLDRLSLDALVALPERTDAAEHSRFQDELIGRSETCLKSPDDHVLRADVREGLLALSRANFETVS